MHSCANSLTSLGLHFLPCTMQMVLTVPPSQTLYELFESIYIYPVHAPSMLFAFPAVFPISSSQDHKIGEIRKETSTGTYKNSVSRRYYCCFLCSVNCQFALLLLLLSLTKLVRIPFLKVPPPLCNPGSPHPGSPASLLPNFVCPPVTVHTLPLHICALP